MKFKEVHLQSVLNYDDFTLAFEKGENGLYLIYGPNETGKSTLLQVLIDILFGGKANPNLYGSASRIYALIEANGKEHAIHRRKRYSRIEVDRNEDSLPEDDITRLLGGYTAEQYRLLFGFDHERLRAGGESLLESEGEAGISLFETGGGLQNLQKLLHELEERSKELLDTSFRSNSKRRINVAVRSYNEAVDQLRKVGLKGDDYQKLRNEFIKKTEEVNKLDEEKKQYELKKEKYERIKRTRNKVFEWENLQSELAGYGDFTSLPDEYIDKIPEKIEQLNMENATLQTLQADKEKREIEMNEIHIDHEILKLGEEIDRLNEGLGQYKTRKYEEIPQIKEQLEQLRLTTREIFQRLAPELPANQLESLRIPFADEESILKLARQLNDLKKDREYIEEQLETRRLERHKKVEELNRIGDLKDVTALKHIVTELRKLGDLEATITNKKLEIKQNEQEIEMNLKRQTIWKKHASELMETALPLEETIDNYHEEWQRFTNILGELQRKLSDAEQNLERINQDLEKMELSGKIPVEEELLAARKYRESGWQLIKKAWLEGKWDKAAINKYSREHPLHLAYEHAVNHADEIADIMREKSKLSATRSHLMKQQKRLKNTISILKDKISEEQKAFERFKETWQMEWDPCGIEAKSPMEMKAWYRNFYLPLIAELHKLISKKNDYETFLELKQQYQERLVKELATHGIIFDEQWHLNDALHLAEKFISQCDEDFKMAEFTKRAIRDIDGKINELKVKLDEFEKLVNETEQQLDMFRMKYPHLPEDAELIEDYIEQIRNLFQHIDQIKQKRSELANKEQTVKEFEERTLDIANHLNDQLDAYMSFEQYVKELQDRYRSASENLHTQNNIKKHIKDLEERIAQKKRKLESLQEEIDHYIATYQCDRKEELLQLVDRSRNFKELQKKINGTKRDLQDQAGKYVTIEELVHEVKTAPEEIVIDQELEIVRHNIQDIELKLTEENRLLGQMKEQLNQLDGSDTSAADLAQDAESYMAEIDRYWNEFLRIEIARKLLQQAIERFREENEGAIIEKAGAYFSKLTLGAYQGLSIEYDGVNPYIEVIHHTGQRWRVPQLSDGTRDQLYLSLRLAFIDQRLGTGESLPIIMDDILVNFDDERSLATLKILDELAEKTQIFYFTHHLAIVQMQNELKNAKVIDLEKLKQNAMAN